MSKFSQALVHGAKVAAHILVAAVLVSVYILATQSPEVVAQFSAFLQHYGVPVALVNVIVAAIIRYDEAELTKNNITIDSLPNDPSQLPPQ